MGIGRIKMDPKTNKIIKEFVILHRGWEMDNLGWIVEDTESKELTLMTTNHESSCVMTKEELFRKISETRESFLELIVTKRLMNY